MFYFFHNEKRNIKSLINDRTFLVRFSFGDMAGPFDLVDNL